MQETVELLAPSIICRLQLFSALQLPRSINTKSAYIVFTIFVCMCVARASVHYNLTAKVPSWFLGLCQWKSAIPILTLRKALCLHIGALSSLPAGQSLCIRPKAHCTPLPYVMSSGLMLAGIRPKRPPNLVSA